MNRAVGSKNNNKNCYMRTNKLNFAILKDRQRQLRHDFPESLSLRTHRALSWLRRAETESDDSDARFVFLWIAFNAAYANEIPNRARYSEKRLLIGFLNRLIDSDDEQLLYNLVWDQFPSSIRSLISNKYVYQSFWDFQNGVLPEAEWLQRFERSKNGATRALGRMNTKKLIAAVFDRLYVIRNQLVHGGSTWNSAVNRSQITDGAKIMGVTVPLIIHLMMEHPNQLWGDPCYPVVS